MNIYQIQEEGEWSLWQARSMSEAVTFAQQLFCKENYDKKWDLRDESPADYYQREILQGCTLIGELENP